METISNKKGVPLLHIALAYVMHKTIYVFPILGGRKVDHVAGSIGALSVALWPEEMGEIEAAYEFDPGFPHTFLSGTLFTDREAPRGAYTPDDIFLTKALGTFDFVEPPKPITPAEAESSDILTEREGSRLLRVNLIQSFQVGVIWERKAVLASLRASLELCHEVLQQSKHFETHSWR